MPLTHRRAVALSAHALPMLVLFIALLAAAPGPAQEERARGARLPTDDTLRMAVVELLEVGWKPSVDANRQIDRLYKEFAGNAWQFELAYALVKMRQWKYDEALPIVERLSRDPHAEVSARHMRMWLLTQQKKYAAALVEMEALAAALPAGEELSDDLKFRRTELVERMGRTFGFLLGPAADALTDFERDSRKRRVFRHLDAAEQELFEEQARRVAEAFFNRVDERDRVVDDALKKAEAEREQQLAQLAEQQTQIGEQLEQLAEDRKAAQQEYDEEAQRIDAKDQPLRERVGSLQSESLALSRDLSYVRADMLRIDERLLYENDPVVRDLLLQQLSDLSRLAFRYNQDLLQLDSSISAVQSQRGELAGQRRALDGRFENTFRQQGQQYNQLQQQQRRNAAQQQRLERQTARVPAQARSLRMQAQALPTYLPFPFEEEKRRLLDAVTGAD